MYPIAGASPNDSTKWATYLLFQLWNPHQNIPATYPVSVRLRVDGAIGVFTGGNSETWPADGGPPLVASGQSIRLRPELSFSVPAPLTSCNTEPAPPKPGPPTGGVFAALVAPPVPVP
jgi:hypothetical protein